MVPAVTTIEVGPGGVDEDLKRSMEERGHTVGEFDLNIGVSEGKSLATDLRGRGEMLIRTLVQGILLQDRVVWASSDSRKNGIAAGY